MTIIIDSAQVIGTGDIGSILGIMGLVDLVVVTQEDHIIQIMDSTVQVISQIQVIMGDVVQAQQTQVMEIVQVI